MDDEDESGGLFAIEVSSEDEATKTTPKVPRDFQSEEDFQHIKKTYKPKIETGELYAQLNLPIENPSKVEAQKILHAIEELYFFRRYDEALDITRQALRGELADEFRKVLEDYERRCCVRIERARKHGEMKG